MKIILIILFCNMYNCFSSHAQIILGRQILASAGESMSNAQLSVSWTAGEAIVGPASGAGLFLYQGFQQPAIQLVSTEESELRKKLSIRIYPNPVTSELYIERIIDESNAWSIQIYSTNGQLFPVSNCEMAPGIPMISVDLSKLPTGQYFLHVRGENSGETGAVSFQKIR